MPYPRMIFSTPGSVDGTAVTTPASLTDATPLPAPELPADILQVGGRVFWNFVGRFTSTATPGTLTIGLYLAKSGVAIASATLIYASSALVPLASQTNKTFECQGQFECVSVGAGGAGVGQVRGSGRVMGLVAAGSLDFIPATVPYAAVSVDTKSNERLLVGLTPSVTTGSVLIHDLYADYSGN